MSCCKSKKTNNSCQSSLKKINKIENEIDTELQKVKLLLSLLNCHDLNKIKPLILENFKKIEINQAYVREQTLGVR
jgi:hypothetical protein